MKTCLLAITGSVAACKAPEIIRSLQSEEFDVHCIVTKSGTEFVAPGALAAISGNPVLSNEYFSGNNRTSPNDENCILALPEFPHIDLAEEIDLLLIAPATADTIARLAHGRANGIFETVALMTKAPILVAPAMNSEMLVAPATQENLEILQKRGIEILPTEKGTLACGASGEGRLIPPEEIAYFSKQAIQIQSPFLSLSSTPIGEGIRGFNEEKFGGFKNKKVLITLGGTEEPLDPVRVLGNKSSGRMGVSLALEGFFQGASVTIIAGKVQVKIPNIFEKVISVQTTGEMYNAVLEEIDSCDSAFFAAAPADFSSKEYSGVKISEERDLAILLQKNPDIAAECGKKKKSHQKFYGFALQTGSFEEGEKIAREKMKKKNLDGIFLNFPENLGSEKGKVFGIFGEEEVKEIEGTKREIAREIMMLIRR